MVSEVKFRKLPISHYIKLLEARTPFAFSRWGDGEWNCMLGEKGHNCDNHDYFFDLGYALTDVLVRNRGYYYGWLNISRVIGEDRILKHIAKNKIETNWVDGSVFVEAGVAGGLSELFRILAKRKVAYVGPDYLRKIGRKINVDILSYVEIPRINCWNDRDRILTDISRVIRVKKPEVICFSSGMPGKIFIDQSWIEGNKKITMIDIGSLFDPFVGVRHRTYHNSFTDDIISKNTRKLNEVDER